MNYTLLDNDLRTESSQQQMEGRRKYHGDQEILVPKTQVGMAKSVEGLLVAGVGGPGVGGPGVGGR